MFKKILISFTLLSGWMNCSAQIATTIVAPTVNMVVSNIAVIKASVSSTYQVTVLATAGNQQTTLVYNQSSKYFEGTIATNAITGIQQGDTVTITVSVTDIQNNQQSKSVNVIYDLPPTLTIKEPLNESVARPLLPLKIYVADKDTCSVTVVYNFVTIFSGKVKDSLSTILNFAASGGGTAGDLTVTVSDKRNQKSAAGLTIYADTNSAMVEYFVADTKIIDFNYDKVLVASGALISPVIDDRLIYPAIISIPGSQRETITLRSALHTERCFLTPFGAVLTGRDSSNFTQNFSWGYDWNNQAIYKLQNGNLNSGISLVAAGNYAIWSDGSSLFRRDLATRTNLLISNSAINIGNDLAANGAVAFSGGGNARLYSNGTSTALSATTNNKINVNPVTDGKNVVYTKQDPCCTGQKFSIYMASPGVAETELSNLGTKSVSASSYYQANNKYIAYVKLGTSGQTNVWLRDTSGNHSQLSFLGQDAFIEKLGANGDVLIRTTQKRYMATRNGSLKEFPNFYGDVYYRDSSWYLALGRVLYKLNLSVTATVPSGNLTSTILLPTVNQLTGNTCDIKVSVKSTTQVSSVLAVAGNQQVSLVYNQASTYFEGTIPIGSIAGIKEGDTVNIVVTSTDIQNNQQVKSVKVIYDLPPTVTFKEPLNESVARPLLPLKVYSTDRDTSTVTIVFNYNTVFSGKIKDSLSTTLNLAAYNGMSGELTVTVTDKQKQTAAAGITIYIDTSSALTEYFAADSKILDFNYNKLLVASAQPLTYPAIISIPGNQRETITLRSTLTANRSYLTPYGAVLTGQDSSNYQASFSYGYDWNNQTIYSLQNSYLNSGLSLKTAGNYAMWSSGTNLIRRDLATRTNTTISTTSGNIDNDLAADGTIAYWSSGYNINLYKNNTNSALTTNANNKWNTYPVTDGNNVVYIKHDPCCGTQNFSIYMAAPGVPETELSNLGTKGAYAPVYYQANNKYIAYIKLGSSGQNNVWLRDTAGNHSQLSFFGQDAYIEQLNPNGDVMLKTLTKRYLAERNGQLKEVNSAKGDVYYRDATWYLALGRMLYKISPSAAIIAETLTTTIKSPVANVLTGNTCDIKVSVKSSNQVSSVLAMAGNQQASLVYNQASSYFEGTIPIAAIAGIKDGDTVNIIVTVTDIQNNQQVKSVKIIYNPPPTITVKEPLSESVARPFIPLKVYAVDKDTCDITVRYLDSLIFTGKIKDSVSVTLNLSGVNGRSFIGASGYLSITVTDKQKQIVQDANTRIYVDTSSILTEYFAADSKILDFNYNKILVASAQPLTYPTIITIAGNQRETIALRSTLTFERCFLTPYGAVLTGRDSSNYTQNFFWGYDWNNHAIYKLQSNYLNSPLSLKTVGNYAIWSDGANILRRDLSSRTDTTISTTAGNTDNDLAVSGAVAYWGQGYNINLYRNNTNSVLTTNANNKWNTYPATDGNNVVYRKHDPCCGVQNYSIYMAAPGVPETELSNLGTREASAPALYQANNKYIAYAKLGTSGQTNIWLRDTMGNHTQLSFFGRDAFIDKLNADGDVLFRTSSKRYLAVRNNPFTEINTVLGTAYYRDSFWYIAIGRMLYKVNIPAREQTLSFFNFSGQKEATANALKWSLEDYTSSVYYKIEQSADLTNFSVMGKINTLSDSTYRHSYQFNDTKPANAVNFYRLRLVFADSSYKYSSVIKINNSTDVAIALMPNPASVTLNVRINTPGDQPVKVEILTLNGRVLYTTSFTTIQGYFSKGVNISTYPSGIYYIRITTPDGITTRSFFKL
jgi:hypothetical protein